MDDDPCYLVVESAPGLVGIGLNGVDLTLNHPLPLGPEESLAISLTHLMDPRNRLVLMHGAIPERWSRSAEGWGLVSLCFPTSEEDEAFIKRLSIPTKSRLDTLTD